MIEFPQFGFASPPCVGGHWFAQCCKLAGLVPTHNDRVVVPPWEGHSRYVLSIVRNPLHWLHSYFHEWQGRPCGVLDVDIFATLYRDTKLTMDGTWRDFVRNYLLHQPGAVGKMFAAYRPGTVIRYEDLPMAAVEFAQSYELNATWFARRARVEHPWDTDRDLRSAVFRAERELCERCDYY